jgi:NAD(P)-dependent dehydrogenase (short-subunit alcohol dehydrogenase family)
VRSEQTNTAGSAFDHSTSLSGKVIIVTGAGGSAGRAVCETLHLAGADIVVVGRDGHRLEALADLFEPKPEPVVADLTDPVQAKMVVDTVLERHHRLDGVIHLVGGWTSGGVHSHDPAAADQLWRQLVGTTANMTTAANEALQATAGRFIAVGAVAVDSPKAQNAVYGAAKTAAEHWVMALADAFGDSGASAFVLRVRALLDSETQQRNPERDYTGWTRVDQLAHAILRNWSMPHTNGIRILA